MSRFDNANPFDEERTNPFDNSSRGHSDAPPPPSYDLGGQYASGSFYDNTANNKSSDADVEIPLGSTKDVKKKEKELKAKEVELKKKEEELRKREAAVGIDVRNWPPFFPIIHHDIAADFPPEIQGLQRFAFFSWLGIIVCLFYNLFGVSARWMANTGGSNGFGNFFLALIYVLFGVPLSYFLWYKRLYNGMRKDTALSYAVFFIIYLIHIAFCIFAAVAPPFLFRGNSFCGVLTMVSQFSDNHKTVGVIYAIGAGFFILETLLSMYVIQGVYMHFRGATRPT